MCVLLWPVCVSCAACLLCLLQYAFTLGFKAISCPGLIKLTAYRCAAVLREREPNSLREREKEGGREGERERGREGERERGREGEGERERAAGCPASRERGGDWEQEPERRAGRRPVLPLSHLSYCCIRSLAIVLACVSCAAY